MPTKSATRPSPAAKTRTADVPRLYRIIVHVGDTEEASAFYGELLGIPGRAVGGGRVYFDCGPVIFALLDAGGRGKPKPLPDHAYFAVKNLKAIHARAEELKCLDQGDVHGDPAGDIVMRPWGEKSFYAVDPWGNALCFVDEKTLFTGE